MIKFIKHDFFNNITEHFHVYHVAGTRIWFTNYFNNHFVIMAMIIWIIAFAKYLFIHRLTPIRIMQTMSRVKMFFTIYGYFVTHEFYKLIFLISRDLVISYLAP